MKATGIVRRIDDLGRVVIPKEIRRTMRIREGDPLEIYTDRNGGVIFKKYSPLGELASFAEDLCETTAKVTGFTCVICDKDAVISACGSGKKDLIDNSISKELEEGILKRKGNILDRAISPIYGDDKYYAKCLFPIISDSEVTGAVVLVSEDNGTSASESDMKILEVSAMFLSKHMS